MLWLEADTMERVTLAVLIALTGAACGAPRAKPMGGDVAATLEKGIERGSATFDHSSWDELLQKHAKNDGRRFDYAGLKADEAQFDAYLDAIGSVDLTTLPSREIQALFVNAYNAYTVRTILDHVDSGGDFAIDSIRDIPDVFDRETHVVGGFTLSLNNIEHNILRPVFKDPRFHFAVNCASISCPPLPTRAFTGDELDNQLERATQSALTNPDYVRVDDDALLVTKIMEWYGGDFVNPDYTGSKKSLPGFIANYATDDVRDFINEKGGDVDVKFRDYDWNLNKP